ncbi:Peptidyl-prolyl cis-trans isomerase FKBP8-like [Homarus americanus]|uniref:peptidylprolyl isomerase n=1 Tax=Homarus americanus TaxID=6706 RepID=A0A8J5K1M1_HOMAM|nr:Peptidyl-prolyl cis-trans isomerase FKBP8-like [Homarus americanus]
MPEVDQSKEVKVEKVEEVEVEGKSDVPDEEWIDILGTGDLKKKVITPGIVESRPSKGSTVVISAHGKLDNGKEVDIHEQLTFTVGDSEVIIGLDMVIPLMDKGEVAEVYVASRFGFGSKGLPPDIPPDSNITYKVELVDYAPEEEPCSLPIAERKDNIKPEVKEILTERLKALNNMGAAQMKIEAYDMALKSLDTVLKCQPNNVKALFRKGKALGLQGKVKESIALLKVALELEPESRLIHIELAKMREKARIEAESEKSLYRLSMEDLDDCLCSYVDISDGLP